MIGDETRRLDPRAAARLIYKTADPTPQQVESIRRELARGRLRGDRAGLWTSPRAVADYLAGRTDSPHGAGRGRAEAPVGFLPVEEAAAARADAVRGQETLVSLYQELLRDYVLAVLRRRQQRHHSALFGRAVVAGQVACLFVLLGLLGFGLRAAQGLRQSPEQAAVARWIAARHGDAQILRWEAEEPAGQGGGIRIRAEYQYFSPSRKRIVSSRAFEVRGDVVREVGDPES